MKTRKLKLINIQVSAFLRKNFRKNFRLRRKNYLRKNFHFRQKNYKKRKNFGKHFSF